MQTFEAFFRLVDENVSYKNTEFLKIKN